MIGRFVGAASMASGFSGAGVFGSSLKCSIHLFHCFCASMIGLLSLLLDGRSDLPYFSVIFFVVSYRCFVFPSVAAFSTIIARSST